LDNDCDGDSDGRRDDDGDDDGRRRRKFDHRSPVPTSAGHRLMIL
jgi:hypothetical protein